jgi:uncharacterized protein YejL (UPF0352 family)
MKEKIIFYIKKAYRPFIRSLILLGLLVSFLIATGVTVNQKNTVDNQISERKQYVDNINEKANQEYQNKINSVECKLAEKQYAEDIRNEVRGWGLLPDSYYINVSHCPFSPFLFSYETDSEFNHLQSLKNKSFISLLFNNLFIGEYSDSAVLIFYLAALLIFLAPIILLLVILYKKARNQAKKIFEEYQKMSSFQKYSLVIFFVILVILFFILLF